MAVVNVNIVWFLAIYKSLLCLRQVNALENVGIYDTTTEVMHMLDSSCVVLVDLSFAHTHPSIVSQLTDAYNHEPLVYIKTTFIADFVWPDGSKLEFSNANKNPHLVDLAILPKQEKDRTCLLESNRKYYPKASDVHSISEIVTLIEFVNYNCHCFRTTAGGLNFKGQHLEEITKNLFSVSSISNVSMAVVNKKCNSIYRHVDSRMVLSSCDPISERNSKWSCD